jgi:hypothetical protein
VSHASASRLDGFLSFWGWHVIGFDDEFHCQKCLLGARERLFRKDMVVGKTETIPMTGNFLYICGVTNFKVLTHAEYMKKNFHMPLRWKAGCNAEMTTYNGYTFAIRDAEVVPFDGTLAKQRYDHLGYPYWSCRNFQFAAQMFVPCLK